MVGHSKVFGTSVHEVASQNRVLLFEICTGIHTQFPLESNEVTAVEELINVYTSRPICGLYADVKA